MNEHASSQQDAWQDLIEDSGLKQNSLVKECRFWKEVDLYVDISENIFIYLYIFYPKRGRGSMTGVHLSYRSPDNLYFFPTRKIKVCLSLGLGNM